MENNQTEVPNGGRIRAGSSSKGMLSGHKARQAGAVIVVAVVVAVILRFLLFGIAGISLVVIRNSPSSLAPTYHRGDLFIVAKPSPKQFNTGEIVVYEEHGRTEPIIHRVVAKTEKRGETYFMVSGDNPNSNDNIDVFPSLEGRQRFP